MIENSVLTWRIIPVSKWLGLPPFISHKKAMDGRGPKTTRSLGDVPPITMGQLTTYHRYVLGAHPPRSSCKTRSPPIQNLAPDGGDRSGSLQTTRADASPGRRESPHLQYSGSPHLIPPSRYSHSTKNPRYNHHLTWQAPEALGSFKHFSAEIGGIYVCIRGWL